MRIEADAVKEEGWLVMLFCVLCNDCRMFGGERECDNDECVKGKCARTSEEGIKRLCESAILLEMTEASFCTSFT